MSNEIIRRIICLVLLVPLLGGCFWRGDDSDKGPVYTQAVEVPPIVVPAGLGGERVQDRLAIPEVEVLAGRVKAGETPRPATFFLREEEEKVKIQKLGERNWLLAGERPAVVWPLVKQFMADNGIPLAREAPTAGEIETQWIEIRSNAEYGDLVRPLLRDVEERANSNAAYDRMRITLEQGVRRNSTEIHLRHLAAKQSISLPQQIEQWPETSFFPEAELEVLREMGGYLAATIESASVSLLAQNISAAEKASIRRDSNGRPLMVLKLDYDRAWATVGQALANAELEVTDLNRDESVFYVDLTEADLSGKKRGFVGRLLDFGGSDSMPIEIRLAPERGDSAYTVAVSGAENQALDDQVGEQVLQMIRDFAG